LSAERDLAIARAVHDYIVEAMRCTTGPGWYWKDEHLLGVIAQVDRALGGGVLEDSIEGEAGLAMTPSSGGVAEHTAPPPPVTSGVSGPDIEVPSGGAQTEYESAKRPGSMEPLGITIGDPARAAEPPNDVFGHDATRLRRQHHCEMCEELGAQEERARVERAAQIINALLAIISGLTTHDRQRWERMCRESAIVCDKARAFLAEWDAERKEKP
jgi:hypothetical protein